MRKETLRAFKLFIQKINDFRFLEGRMYTNLIWGSVTLAVALTVSSIANSATLDVLKIRITNNLAHSATLQVNEVIAKSAATGEDVALASAGATVAASPSLGSPFFASKTIDGLIDPGYGFFHGVFQPTDFVEVTLAEPTALSALTIVGRQDCCNSRDSYIVELFNSAGGLLFSEALDARTAGATGATFELPPSSVPLPASTLMLGVAIGALRVARWLKSA